eukprot:CAMPEP_0116559932 /NCGR_PEP_ID=MMETSP0397-20121206/10686_1 /TAXON_ID=216820 /ORGANISM="Cyclophora tenuis, Strain ECT3854" /LENGTH=218 /DNA_ID=CAMNT_0004085787 /DNA_START=74 /DNA_END=728 /DNA_ORIENTATION=-
MAILWKKEVLVPESAEVARTYNDLGEALIRKGEYDEALSYLRRAEEIAVVVADNSLLLARIYSNIGSVLSYEAISKWTEALGYLHKSLAIREKKKPQSLIVAETHNTIGTLLHDMGDFSGALDHFHQSLAIQSQLDAPRSMKVAFLHNNIALVLKDNHDMEGAMKHIKIAIAIQMELSSSLLDAGALLGTSGEIMDAGWDWPDKAFEKDEIELGSQPD